MDEKIALANAVVKALGYAENGGKPDVNNPSQGKSGEMKSIFQYTPNTWHAVAAKYLGNANAPLNPDTETAATLKRVSHWIDEGYTAKQIASMWNAGEGKPNAYKENWKGVNEHGVAYDTPAYAEKVNSYAQQFYMDEKSKEGQQPESQQQPAPAQNSAPQDILSLLKSTMAPKPQGLMGSAISFSGSPQNQHN